MRRLSYYISNPFQDPNISMNELVAFTTDNLEKMIANDAGGIFTARIAATTPAFNLVQTKFAADLSKLGLRKGRKALKDAFRAALAENIARIHAALVVKYGTAGAEITECFPLGRKVFGTCTDDQLKPHLTAMNTGLAAHEADLGAALVADGAAVEASWTAIWEESESSSAVKTASQAEKNAARAALQVELFKNLLTIGLHFPDDEDKLALYMTQSLLEDPTAEVPLPGAAELSLEAPSAPSRAAFTIASTDADTVTVYYRLLSEPDFTVLAEGVALGLYETADLPAGDYEFKAAGVNETGTGPQSEALSVTIA